MDTSLFLRAVIVHFQVSESHLSDRKILILSVKRTVKRILTLTHASLCRIYFPSLRAFCVRENFKSTKKKLLTFPQSLLTTCFKIAIATSIPSLTNKRSVRFKKNASCFDEGLPIFGKMPAEAISSRHSCTK